MYYLFASHFFMLNALVQIKPNMNIYNLLLNNNKLLYNLIKFKNYLL
jgi:hypothetical protein